MNIQNQKMMQKEVLKQRVADFKAFCKSNRINTIDVVNSCGFKYSSTIHLLNRPSISTPRLETLELKAIELAKLQVNKTTTEVVQYETTVNTSETLGNN